MGGSGHKSAPGEADSERPSMCGPDRPQFRHRGHNVVACGPVAGPCRRKFGNSRRSRMIDLPVHAFARTNEP